MALWLPWRRWFAGTDYEIELPRIAEQIRAAQAAAQRSQAAQRRLPALFLLQTAVVYVAYALFILLSRSRRRAIPHATGLLVAPVAIALVFTALRRLTRAYAGYRARQLSALTARRKKLVDEYKKKTNYDKIHELIAEVDPADPSRATSPNGRSPKNANGAKGAKPGRNAKGPSNGPKGASGGNAKEPPENSASGSPAPQRSPEYAPYRRTWVDRILDLVLGEDEMSPANRYALICPACYTHNGLAPFGKKAEEVTYRCPVCGRLNEAIIKLEKPTSVLPELNAVKKAEAQADADADADADAGANAENEKDNKDVEGARREGSKDAKIIKEDGKEKAEDAKEDAKKDAKKDASAGTDSPAGKRKLKSGAEESPEPVESLKLSSTPASPELQESEKRILEEIERIKKEVEESREAIEKAHSDV